MVTARLYDVVLALGVEKLYHADKREELRGLQRRGRRRGDGEHPGSAEAERAPRGRRGGVAGAGEKRSMFMDIYAAAARAHMQRYGTTARAVRRGRGEELASTAA